MTLLLDRYENNIAFTLSCWDRVVIQGTLPGLCYADGMTSYLNSQNVRIFDYPKFAAPLRDAIRQNAERLAEQSGIEIEFVRKTTVRKLLQGEHNIQGFRNLDLRRQLPYYNAGQMSRLLKRLRVHGLIKRIGRTYKYYVTRLGRCTLLAGMEIRQYLLPELLTANR